ncbi:MAG: peptide-methionine (S)-S-oxide reductase MsrA [Lentisphaerae bacterium]|nr:peptide-methionine (S)-S-oxide reductase MsrA [Lentisphaerota bacterium]
MRIHLTVMSSLLALGALAAFAESPPMDTPPTNAPAAHAYASFGLGCFWCGEAVFQRVEGVVAVASGYQGGHVPNPTYKQVCQGDTGHAEVIRVEFDPARVSYDELLDIFWQAHDPTQANGQGHDIGPQYRSVIFCYSEEQKQQAEASKAKAGASGKFKRPLVTEIVPATEFFKAEDYHQDFYNNNRSYPYCRMIISPKLKKLGMAE